MTIGKFGIDLRLLIAEIVNFLILMWILKKLVYKPLLSSIRQGEIELAKAARERVLIEKEKSAIEERRKRIAIKSRKQARSIIDKAKLIAKDIKVKTATETEHDRQSAIEQLNMRLSEIEHE
jgi:F-type H+-transporting ATPase subunit b